MSIARPRAARLSRVVAAVAFAGMVGAAGAAGCGAEDGVVGGDCATGYTQCGLACVDTQSDPENCGTCGSACASGTACNAGVCGGSLDGSEDGSAGDGAMCGDAVCPGSDGGGDGSGNEASSEDGSSADGTIGDGTIGDGTIGDGSGEDGSREDGSAEDGSGEEGSSSGGDGSSGGSDGSSGGSDGSSGGSDGSSGGSDGSSGGSDGSSGGSDGSLSDGSSGGTDGSSGGTDGSSGGSDGSARDGSGSGGDACAPPLNTPENCGACGNSCSGTDDLCLLVDGGFQCSPRCPPPLTACGGECVNLSRDPNNCGMCGLVCPSQYCFLATCQGNLAGSIVVLGHDFQKTKSTDPQAKLLENAVFYNPGSVNLLSFEEYADAATVTNGLGLLKGFATAQSITLNVQSTKDPTVLASDVVLASESAVLVWDQPNAPSGVLGSYGTEWAPHLSKYVQGGGIVIVLDAAQGVGQMPSLLNNGALLAITGHGAYAAGNPVDVPLAGLSVARGMPTVYPATQNSAWFTTSEPSSITTLYVANVAGEATELLAVQKVVN